MDYAVELDAAAAMMVMHRCKVCGKGFASGRSLGGHMRSHISLGEAVAAAEVVDGGAVDDEVKHGGLVNGARYGLRENPKKTRRLSDFADEEGEEEVEEEGGGDGGEQRACRECGELFSSWRSLFGHMRSHAPGARDHDHEEEGDEFGAEEAESEKEEEEIVAPAAVTVIAATPRRRRRSMRVAAPAPMPPPVAMGGFEKEQEDVARCLLMLSRDPRLWTSHVKAEQRNAKTKQPPLPRNGYNSDDDPALLQYGGAKAKNKNSGGNVVVVKTRKRRTSYYSPNSISPKQQQQQQCAAVPAKRTRFECPGCGKVFTSYQALGGHRASHKRINTSCSAPKVAATAAPEPSVETCTSSFGTPSPSVSPVSVAAGIGYMSPRKANKSSAAATEKFECPYCFKVFASGQALGGHKRSHAIDGVYPDNGGELYAGAEQEQHSAGFLDLNFPPAPSEEA